MNKFASIEHQLLLAMPTLNDPIFFQTVIYLCEYNMTGAMGIIVNKPMEITLGEILRHLHIQVNDENVDNYRVMKGGPLARDQGFILQRKEAQEILLSSSKQDLAVLANGEGLDDAMVALGYSAWESGQLEQEIRDNSWLVAPFDPKILFDVPYELRWRRAAASIGVDFDLLSGDAGHA